ncbi:alpha/beta hydrolase [Changchengzhania lutea]|uniref:alpha/beta hydrolase n=1 Tax=Changchengzhania lutea TaxID=2049305 RepID=UPI00115D451C|nr:alpha/beta hydrolase-fold protein [Changchengzhania lutea]
MRPFYTLIIFVLLSASCKNAIKETKETIEVNDIEVVEAKTDAVDTIYNDILVNKLSDAVLESGSIFRIDSFPTHFIKPRPVDIWLPENYSEENKYAVLYMHDGQNLFDSTTTWNKKEWKVDEWASKLMKNQAVKNFIVVGIHNIPELRWQDLFPEKALNYLNKEVRDSLFSDAKKKDFNMDFRGDNYLKFLVAEVKPFIDANYTTFANQENTFVAGSSMGGLMSMYAICEYPDIFNGAACLSTHWLGGKPNDQNPFPDAIFDYLEEHVPDPNTHRLYFDYGTESLDAFYPQYAPRVDAIFKAKGYTNDNFKNLKYQGTTHSESSWSKRLDIPFTFLLGNKND